MTRRIAIQLALIATVLATLAWAERPDGLLHVTFLDVDGDAALVQLPDGGFALIDGGANPSALAAALGRRMPFWRRALEAVVLTSAGATRLPGQIAALERYEARLALAPNGGRGASAARWRELLAAQGVTPRVARAGDRLRLGGATLRVLSAAGGRLTLRLDYGATSVVFAQAGDEADEAALAARAGTPAASLVAYPWQRDPHGPLLAAIRPAAIVFTDGQSSKRPAELTFPARAVNGASVYHRQVHGAIEWISDGRRTRIITDR